MITAIYNRNGYSILSDHNVVYEAGNSRHDSQAMATTDAGALTLAELKKMSEQTAREIAAERGEQYNGVSFEPVFG